MTVSDLNLWGFRAFLFLLFLGVAAIAITVLAGLWRFPGPGEPPGSRMSWGLRPVSAIRTGLDCKSISHRITQYAHDGGVVEMELEPIPVTSGSAAGSTFVLRYKLNETPYVVRGRIVQGSKSRLVLLRYQRPLNPALTVVGIVWGLALSMLLTQHRAADPLFAAFDKLSLVAAICTAFLFPFLGVIPNRLVLAVNNTLATVLAGEVERA